LFAARVVDPVLSQRSLPVAALATPVFDGVGAAATIAAIASIFTGLEILHMKTKRRDSGKVASTRPRAVSLWWISPTGLGGHSLDEVLDGREAALQGRAEARLGDLQRPQL
jgi:hypothetical protein